MLCSIILPVPANAAELLSTLEALVEATGEGAPFELILVETTSSPEHAELYASLEGDLTVLTTEGPLGVVYNEGARYAKGHRLVFLEPGVQPTPSWLETLLGAEADLSVGSLVDADGHLLRSAYGFRQEGSDLKPYALYAGISVEAQVLQHPRSCQAGWGGAIAISSSLFGQLEGFEAGLEGFWMGLDLGLRVSKTGLRVTATPAKLRAVSMPMLSATAEFVASERFQERWADRITPDLFTLYASDGFRLAGLSDEGRFEKAVLIGPRHPDPIKAEGLDAPWPPCMLERNGETFVLPALDSAEPWTVRGGALERDPALRYEVRPDPNDSLSLQLQLVSKGSRVLELGCSGGHMSRRLKEHGCTVVGVELDPEAAAHAQPYAERVIVGNIEEMDLEGLGLFDAILAGDVIEHLRDPEAALRRVSSLLAPGGCLIGSVPNVAHASIRLALLAGQWRYRGLGLLDRTHLRFFTRWSLLETLRRAGYRTDTLWSTVAPAGMTEIKVPDGVLPPGAMEAVLADPEASHYQYVFRALPMADPRQA